MPLLETPRLRLRPVRSDDAAFFNRLLNEPSWIENIGDRNVRSEAEAASYIREQIEGSYQVLGYGIYLLERKEDEARLGICGLVKRDFFAYPDLGFALLPEYLGCGYAAEAARSVIEVAGSRWGIEQLYAIVKLGNHRSLRLLDQLGFQRQRTYLLRQGEEVELYAKALMHSRLPR